jgi:hypothetical protein
MIAGNQGRSQRRFSLAGGLANPLDDFRKPLKHIGLP